MLNKIILIFIFLNSVLCISQPKLLYIFYDDKFDISIYKSISDSLQNKEYRFDLSIPSKYLDLYFKNNNIISKISAPDGEVRFVSFLWLNENNNNEVFLTLKGKIKNKIHYSQMKKIKSLTNLAEFIGLFDEIFLIKEEEFFDGYYLTRKVSLRPLNPKL